MNNNDGYIYSIKELYDQYWKCRNFELNNLWNRSVFLTAFIIIFLSAYGLYFKEIFIEKHTIVVFNNNNDLLRHFAGLLLCTMGLVFSILWICLSKSSKAWYEVYEQAISAIDTSKYLDTPFLQLPYVGGFNIQNLDGFIQFQNRPISELKPKFDQYLHTTNGGLFSPSKINIAIGQSLFVLWLFISFFHTSCILSLLVPNIWIVIFFTAQIFITIFVLLIPNLYAQMHEHLIKSILSKWIGSGVLKKKDPRRY